MKDSDIMNKKLRLQVFLARCGVGSRRGCEEIIKSGRVSVNSKTVTDMGVKIGPSDTVKLDSRKLNIPFKKVYIALNKPKGCLCTNNDNLNRPIALDFLKKATRMRIFHVGRLDYNSSGLIFFTNDGDFSEIVTHPSYCIEKEYYIEASRIIPEELLKSYKNGLVVENINYKLKHYKILNDKSAVLTLQEGKNREIRKVFRNSNIFLKKIVRKRIGIVRLNELTPGKYRYLTKKEIEWFFNIKKEC